MTDRWRRGEPHEDDRLSALLDDELPEPEALEVTRHLSHCDTCLAELEALRTTRTALRGLPGIAPPAAMLSRVAQRAVDRRHRRTRARRVASAVLVAVALVGTAGFLAGGDRGTVVPPVELFVVDHVARTGGGPVIAPVDLRDGR